MPPESAIKHPSELKGVPISVGYQSGSHYSTIQGLEQYMGLDDIKLSFADGLLFSRLEKLIDRKVPAASLFSGPYYFLEQLGFRKVIDTTFMMATMINGDPDPEDQQPAAGDNGPVLSGEELVKRFLEEFDAEEIFDEDPNHEKANS